jgi:hypothetical protein
MSLAVISCIFNWQGYTRPRANAVRFQRQMTKARIPVYGLEAVLPQQRPVSLGWPGWRQVRATRRHVMFQKEAMLNEVEKFVPHHFKRIAVCDSDIDFGRSSWADDTLAALEQFPAVQPFSEAEWMGMDGLTERSQPAAATISQSGNHVDGHPGFAWAFRREFFTEQGGLYPYCVCGHGDIVNSTGFYGLQLRDIQKGFGSCPDALWHWESWRDTILNWTRREVGSVPGTVYHEWHGSRDDRAYAQRIKMIEGLQPARDLELDESGLLRWTDDADPALMISVADYFKSRTEDG